MPRKILFPMPVGNLKLTEKESGNGSPFTTGKLQDQAPSSKRLSGGGRKQRDAQIDQDIFEWFSDKRSQGIRITGKALLLEAQRRFVAGGIASFKASRGWLEKQKARHSVST